MSLVTFATIITVVYSAFALTLIDLGFRSPTVREGKMEIGTALAKPEPSLTRGLLTR